jgi:hypothetical protein
MFRRARTHLCGPICDVKAPLGIEAFQIWHLLVANEDELKVLIAALEKDDEKILAALPFRRVGILRYRDESAFSEEPAERVLAMWRDAQPGSRAVLGRIWESAPTAGQGWQNRSRLRNMLDQISSLATPPEVGSGALMAIPVPPRRLADAALDGGMLVVTMGDAKVRKALLIYSNYDSPNHFLNGESPHVDLGFDNDVPIGTALTDFVGNLTANQPVRGVTVAVTKAPVDAGAADRLQAVVKAVAEFHPPAPAQNRQKTAVLNEHDQKQLSDIGIGFEKYDDIIFLELNAGG